MHKPYILVTGASSAIGSEIAKVLSHKYNLILHGRDAEKLEKLKTQLECNTVTWEYDLSNISMLSQDIETFLENNNIIDIYGFVHVSGSTELFPIKNSYNEQWIDMFNINLFSGVFILRVLFKKKYMNNFKSAVFISSTLSIFGAKAQSAYCASKAAIDGFVRAAALELAPSIRINSILPGGVEIGRQHMVDDYEKKLKSAHPLGFGEPIDIANMVEYLLSEKARWITGQSFIMDGGYSVNHLK